MTSHSTDRVTSEHQVRDTGHDGEGENAATDKPCFDSEFDNSHQGSAESAQLASTAGEPTSPTLHRRTRWAHLMVFVVMPLLAMVTAGGAGYFRYLDETAASTRVAEIEATAAARDATAAMFSYTPATAEAALNGARDRLTGQFRDQFTTLVNDYALPGAVQYKVSTHADVAAVAVIAANPTRVTLMLFVNQSATIGGQAPANTAFTARTTLERVDGRWLIATFEPI